MNRIQILFSILFISLFSQGQKLDLDYNNLSQEVVQLINNHRKKLKLNELKNDDILFKAAKDHSNYMVKNNKLDHKENIQKKETPHDRVIFHGGTHFYTTGENILFLTVESKKYNTEELKKLAAKIYFQWKKSNPHYKNMIHSEFDQQGLSFSYDEKTKRLYATQVFGGKGTTIPKQLSNNTFGLTSKSIYCKDVELSDKIHIGNSIRIEGNEVILYYHDIEKFKSIFQNPSDAIAIDIVEKSQLSCGKSNNFDSSPIYDGVLLKPIYKDELISNNRAENKLKLITKVGEIPPHLIEKEVTANCVFIFSNCACEYVVPHKVNSKSLSLYPIIPSLLIPKNVTLRNKGIIKSDEHTFAFDRNEIIQKLENSNTTIHTFDSDLATVDDLINDGQITIHFDTIPSENSNINHEEIEEDFEPYEFKNEKIHSSFIYSYSSVEGKEQHNRNLYLQRAIAIEKYGKKELNITVTPSKVIAEENWATCYIQLEMENLDEIVSKSKNEIRQYINANQTKWEDYLKQQRISKLVANYYGELTTKQPNNEYYLNALYNLNLRTGIFEKNEDLTNLALAKLYELEYSYSIFEEMVFNEIMDNKNLVQNACAVLIKNYRYNRFNTVKFLKKWLTQIDLLNKETQLNLLILYCIINKDLLNSWDISTSKLANVTKPTTLEKDFQMFQTNLHLIANYNYISLYYANHINDYKNINLYFYKVYNSFKNNIKKPKDRVNLALFLNRWSSYDTAIDLLKTEIKKNTFTKEEALLLAQTYPIIYNEKKKMEMEEILRKVYQLNKTEWCEWQSKNINLLRNNIIKKEYCQKCN